MVEAADSLWAARHLVARAVAFGTDPLRPAQVLPAEIWRRDARFLGGCTYVETISTASELTSLGDQRG
jgi:hypothetical protein